MSIKREYQICTNCVMDTTDWSTTFDDAGVCNHCSNFYENIKPNWHPDAESESLLVSLAEKIRKEGKRKKYDCIIGFSGGVDSSYLAYIAKERLQLNPLLYVVDTGWNLDITRENIKNVSEGLQLDVVTETVNWEEMKDLQLAFLKSQISSQDLPQDHAIFAGLYNYAVRNGFKYVLTGANIATECILPGGGWGGGNDLVLIKDIHRKHGKENLSTFPFCSMFKYRIYYAYFCGMKRVAPLNYLPFDPLKVEAFLHERFNWQGYENKHYENLFTRWYEGYYMPRKFGYDKRKTYYSSLILSGNMSREEAIKRLSQEPYNQAQAENDTEAIASKLGITKEELEAIITQNSKTIHDYRNSQWAITLGKKIAVLLGVEKRFVKK